VNRKRVQKTLEKWSKNAYQSVLWGRLETLLVSLGFDVKNKGGTARCISHEVLKQNQPDFSPIGAFVVDIPHSKGDPVDPKAMKKKIIPAIEMVLQSLSVEDNTDETDS
jgi:hypothetical protein